MRKRMTRSNWRVLACALAMVIIGLEAPPLAAARPPGTLRIMTILVDGVDRQVAVYVPTSYRPGTGVPLVVALHGGGGDASKMYDPGTHITDYAEAEGFIAAFPNGLPKPNAPPGSGNYYWSDPVNLKFMDRLIDSLGFTFTIDARRVYFIGFSGGAKLIYGLAADPRLSARIAAVATVAGEMGKKETDPPTSPWEIIDPSASGGVPLSALLLQGGRDQRMPEKGGFDDDFERILTSFQMKVDIWRLFVDAKTGSGVTLPFAPTRVEAMRYVNSATGQTVVSAIDPVLFHTWPEWNYMGTIWDFFTHVPTR